MLETPSTRHGSGAASRLDSVAIVGAGVAGLVAANLLAARGLSVTVVERDRGPGGKLRPAQVAGRQVDAGPTVLTLVDVLEETLGPAALDLRRELELRPAATLARHAWGDRAVLDLHADPATNLEAIGRFAGPREARGYRGFCADAARLHRALSRSFMHAARPSTARLMQSAGLTGLLGFARVSPFRTLWEQTGRYFADDRLRQLFGRYSTYVGSSPFEAPATLAVIAHVEQRGVWLVPRGMYRLAEVLERHARALGARFVYERSVDEVLTSGGRAAGLRLDGGERVDAGAVIVNADPAALSLGLLGTAARRAVRPPPPGTARSLSATTWCMLAHCEGFPLAHHSVFFSQDYRAEFESLFGARRVPSDPTIYVCAQDRDDSGRAAPDGPERLLVLVNAPAEPPVAGERDSRPPGPACLHELEQRVMARLARSGLSLRRQHPDETVIATPAGFAARFPATGGALYGAATHGWRASFERPGARTAIAGLYLAGGGCHPGAGVPMAAVSGRLAAEALCSDLDSTSR